MKTSALFVGDIQEWSGERCGNGECQVGIANAILADIVLPFHKGALNAEGVLEALFPLQNGATFPFSKRLIWHNEVVAVPSWPSDGQPRITGGRVGDVLDNAGAGLSERFDVQTLIEQFGPNFRTVAGSERHRHRPFVFTAD